MRILALLWCACTAWAQNTGRISGKVVSSLSGDPVAQAAIQATNRSTHAVIRTTSLASGAYTLEAPAGAYDLSATAPGYNATLVQSVNVEAIRTTELELRLLDYQLDTLGDGREFRIDLTSPHPTPSGPTPRTAEGRPDFSGVWYAQRPVEPGTPEPLPWAEALVKERAANNSKDSPGAHCLPRGITLAGALFPFKLVQTRTLLVMLVEDDIPSHRQIFLDGRAHPKDPNPSWMGHSAGHWEGDTLVVDTVGFNDKSWLDPQGHPHTEQMRVIERMRRPDLGHLEIEFTIDDPGAYAKPWVFKRVADLDPDDEVGEYVCTENNRDPAHMVGK